MGYPHYNECQTDYASKGVAGSALGLGIAGLSVALLNGGLGNIFGNNNHHTHSIASSVENQYVSSLQAENAMLKAENYSDKVSKEVYAQTLTDNSNLRNDIIAFIKSEQAHQNEKSDLREQILVSKINEVAMVTKGRFDALDNTINCLAGQVNRNTTSLSNITKVVIPQDVICPEVMPRYNSWTAPTTTAPASA